MFGKSASVFVWTLLVASAGCSTEPVAELARHSAALSAEQCAYFEVGGKVQLCHKTASAKNPYTILRTSVDGCVNGHALHAGDYVSSNDPSDPKYDPTCNGQGCFPEGAPYDGSVECCEGLVPEGGRCVRKAICASATRVDASLTGSVAPVAGPSGSIAKSMGGAEYALAFTAATNTLKVSIKPLLPAKDNLVFQQFAVGLRTLADSVANRDTYTIAWGSADGNPWLGRTFEPDPALGAGWYSHVIDLEKNCDPTTLGAFFVVNVREDNARDLQRFIGVTSMTTPNSWGTFDWSWANRLKLGIGEVAR